MSMPHIVFGDEANEIWERIVNEMEGFGVEVTIQGEGTVEATLCYDAPVTRDDEGMPVLNFRPGFLDEATGLRSVPAEKVEGIYIF